MIKVLEGKGERASENRVLGTLELVGLPTKPGSDIEVEILFEIDANYVLTVVAKVNEAEREAKRVFTDISRNLIY